MTTEKIRIIHDRLLIEQSWQKSYEDQKIRELEFHNVGEHIFLKVSPSKGIIRFRKKENEVPGSSDLLKF